MSGHEGRRTWFHGEVGWWQYWLYWLLQSVAAVLLCLFVLGSWWGPTLGAILSGLLLFRQVNRLVESKLSGTR